ncbi:MAG: radical SAM protein [Anaerolineaceae bacterium]|nr:radical SAM protein [Anaerolineaceae bacterium]
MNYVFGPVPSRRLGKSLGIDPVPLKTCNWNCVYCQLGRSIPLSNERKEFFPVDEILLQVKKTLQQHKNGEIDWITFVGSGETTLNINLGHLIRAVKQMTSIPIAVITNGSLLYLPAVRQDLKTADAVLPSLDAGNPGLYKKINRPHPEVTFSRYVDGLKAFHREYQGKLWIEVMLVKDLNDSERELLELTDLFATIHPDEIHILQPTRPPVEPWVHPADDEKILRAKKILGSSARVIDPVTGGFDLGQHEDLTDAIVDIITRHPMKEIDLIETLQHYPQANAKEILQLLAESGKAQVVIRYGERYWSSLSGYYPENSKEEK